MMTYFRDDLLAWWPNCVMTYMRDNVLGWRCTCAMLYLHDDLLVWCPTCVMTYSRDDVLAWWHTRMMLGAWGFTKYRKIEFLNFDVVKSWKLLLLEKKFQLQSCLEFDFEQLCNWKFFSKINSFQDMKYRQIDFVNFDIIISWKLLLLERNFQWQSCSEFD